jgi:hypothetical protein
VSCCGVVRTELLKLLKMADWARDTALANGGHNQLWEFAHSMCHPANLAVYVDCLTGGGVGLCVCVCVFDGGFHWHKSLGRNACLFGGAHQPKLCAHNAARRAAKCGRLLCKHAYNHV